MARFTSYNVPNHRGGGLIVEVLPKRQVKVRLHTTKEVVTVPFDGITPEWSAHWMSEEKDGMSNEQVRSKIRRKKQELWVRALNLPTTEPLREICKGGC